MKTTLETRIPSPLANPTTTPGVWYDRANHSFYGKACIWNKTSISKDSIFKLIRQNLSKI